MTAPRWFYDSFDEFLADELRVFLAGDGTVTTESVGTGPHILRMMRHASRVASGDPDRCPGAIRRKGRRIVREIIDPFLSECPAGVVVLGGHSYGSIEMECVREMIEAQYSSSVVAAAYALAPVAHQLDPKVKVITAERDWLVPLSNLVTAGTAVDGDEVAVPGLDHTQLHDSPEARELLRSHFNAVADKR
jgi:hypothetical protein